MGVLPNYPMLTDNFDFLTALLIFAIVWGIIFFLVNRKGQWPAGKPRK